MSDPVKRPAHYTSHPSGIECIRITQHMTFCAGSVVKYLWRAGLKVAPGSTPLRATLEDLQKAREYLEYEIARVEAEIEAVEAKVYAAEGAR